MKGISPQQQDKLRELVIELDGSVDEVRNAILTFNTTLRGSQQELDQAVKDHTPAAVSLKEFLIGLGYGG